MYSTLPSTPPPLSQQGPQPLQGPISSILRFILRFINTILVALSVLIQGFAAYMYYNPIHSDDPPDDPPSLEPYTSHLRSLNDIHDVIDRLFGRPLSWFVATVLGVGVYVFATSALALSGTTNMNRSHLFAHMFLMTALVLSEVGVFILASTENKAFEHLPEDISGWWPATEQFIATNAQPVRLAAVIIIAIQLFDIAAASFLHIMYEAAYYAWKDEVDEVNEIRRRRLGLAVVQTYSDDAGDDSPWVKRLHNKYNVDQRQWRQADAAARQQTRLLTASTSDSQEVQSQRGGRRGREEELEP